MAKTLYKANFNDKLPLGGIATGHLYLQNDGSVISDNFCSFLIKAEKDGELLDVRVLQSSKNSFFSLPCFEKSESFSYFPFAEILLSDTSFPASVKLSAFSPFIPLSDTDSGIPAVMFEFEITNTSNERLDFSICNISGNTNPCFYNRMGCTDTGEAYLFLSGNKESESNNCIATNSKNVSFCEYGHSCDDLCENFVKNQTLLNTVLRNDNDTASFGALCSHFSLAQNETQKISFCYSWYHPENDFSRNYYAQYFESSLECASYLFRQEERLKRSSMDFCKYVSGATLPENILKEVNNDLFKFIEKNFIRLDDGRLISDCDEHFEDFESFINRSDNLSYLFPGLEHSQTEYFYKNALYETASDKETVLAILKSYRKFVLTADRDALIEEWYYIVKCMEKLFGEDGKQKCKADTASITACIQAAVFMSEAVRDKKRFELYTSILEEKPIEQFSMDITSGFAKLCEISGFEYDAEKMHIGFAPKSDICPLDDGGTFRCFFCTPKSYGYVEEGIDYIEINLLHGSLDIKSFGVPRTPRLVQYGGRNWRFENKNLVAILDSTLEITPTKKLTIFIDIKQ